MCGAGFSPTIPVTSASTGHVTVHLDEQNHTHTQVCIESQMEPHTTPSHDTSTTSARNKTPQQHTLNDSKLDLVRARRGGVASGSFNESMDSAFARAACFRCLRLLRFRRRFLLFLVGSGRILQGANTTNPHEGQLPGFDLSSQDRKSVV